MQEVQRVPVAVVVDQERGNTQGAFLVFRAQRALDRSVVFSTGTDRAHLAIHGASIAIAAKGREVAGHMRLGDRGRAELAGFSWKTYREG